MNVNLMNEKTRRGIIEDLLLRKPSGDPGQNPVYTEDTYYCYEAHKNKKRIVCSHAGWGYSHETIWDLGFRGECEVQEYIFNTFYKDTETKNVWYLSSGRKAGVTRKSNRVWSRISSSIVHTTRNGNIEGLYKGAIGWETQFFLYGNSVDEIKSLAETMLRPIYSQEDFTITFVDKSVPGDILDKNVKSFANLESKVSSFKERAAKALANAETLETQAEYVKTLITQNLEVAMRAT